MALAAKRASALLTAPITVHSTNLVAPSPLYADGGHDAAKAIMTTDTVCKEMAVQLRIDGKVVTIAIACAVPLAIFCSVTCKGAALNLFNVYDNGYRL